MISKTPPETFVPELPPETFDPESAPTARRRMGRRLVSAAVTSLVSLTAVLGSAPAQGGMYKCRTPDGGITYSDQACPNGGGAWKPRANVTVLPSSSFTGGRAKATEPGSASARPDWLKPIDPIGDCKRRGGEIDRELRACRLP